MELFTPVAGNQKEVSTIDCPGRIFDVQKMSRNPGLLISSLSDHLIG